MVDGYDPDWYRSVYLDARRTVFGEDDTGYRSDKAGVNEICSEINRRNASWVYDKSPGIAGAAEGAKPSRKEVAAAAMLNAHGFDVEFVRPAGVPGVRTADCKMGGRFWELKQPTGDVVLETMGKNTIDHQFEAAVGQSRRLALDVTVVEAYPGVTAKGLEDAAAAAFYGKWSGAFDELLVISREGLRRFKK